jgi:VanZ family protein
MLTIRHGFFFSLRQRVHSSPLKPSRTMHIAPRSYRWKTRIKNWLPVWVWAGLIFFFSTDHFSFDNTAQIFGFVFSWLLPAMPSDEFAPVHGAMRKLGHWGEYFVLAILLLQALRKETDKKWKLRHAVLTLAFVFVYALSDELHQSFVPSRTASFGDVTIDVLGGIGGIFWMYWYSRGILAPLTPRISEN